MRPTDDTGKVKIGLIVFVVLLAAVAGRFIYRYADKATRLNNEAIELMNRGKYDSALDKLREALEANPDHLHANYHRGICLAEKHDWDEAIAAFDRVITLDPKEANAHFNKGRILFHLERWEPALASFEKAAGWTSRLEAPNRDTVQRYIGECHYEMHLDKLANTPEEAGNPRAALTALKTYLNERPGAPDKTAIQQKIDILENPDNYKDVIAKRKKTERKQDPALRGLRVQ